MLLNQEQLAFLLERVHVYNWWEPADKALESPKFIVAKMMDLGLPEDLKALFSLFPKEYLIERLQQATIGEFCPQSWHYWHYYLLGMKYGEVPEMPKRIPDEDMPKSIEEFYQILEKIKKERNL